MKGGRAIQGFLEAPAMALAFSLGWGPLQGLGRGRTVVVSSDLPWSTLVAVSAGHIQTAGK